MKVQTELQNLTLTDNIKTFCHKKKREKLAIPVGWLWNRV